jgi:hypothetical protein
MSDLEEQEEYREDSQVEEGESDDDFLTQFRAVLDKLRANNLPSLSFDLNLFIWKLYLRPLFVSCFSSD